MAVEAYIKYHLLFLAGAGYSPAEQVHEMGMTFEGGQYKKDGAFLGYLLGDSERVSDTIDALAAWRVLELTENEALAWSEAALAVNTVTEDIDGNSVYFGPAETDAHGYVVRPTASEPYEV